LKTYASRGPKGEEWKTKLDSRTCEDVVVDQCLQGAKLKNSCFFTVTRLSVLHG
jgi:hypothetical protein